MIDDVYDQCVMMLLTSEAVEDCEIGLVTLSPATRRTILWMLANPICVTSAVQGPTQDTST